MVEELVIFNEMVSVRSAASRKCLLTQDSVGYYIVNMLCVIVGIVTFWGFIKPAALKLQGLPLRAWRIPE